MYNQANFNWYWNVNAGPRPRNRVVSTTEIPALYCPSDPTARKWTGNSAPTSYMLSAGPVSGWYISANRSPGPFSRESSKGFRDFLDGTANTILAAEGVIGNNRNKESAGYRNSRMGRLRSTGTFHNRVFNDSPANLQRIKAYFDTCVSGVATGNHGNDDQANRFWASGRVHWGPWFNTLMPPNSNATSDGTVSYPGNITINCDDDTSVTTMDIKNASSHHPGGAHVLMGDGAVGFVSETIDHKIWVGAGSIDGNEDTGGGIF